MEKAELIDIIQKCKDGDLEAMEKLLLHAHTSVSYQCRKMLRNEQDAEDMTQEILVTVYQKLDSLSEPAAFHQWLKKITVTRCINALNRTHVELQFAEDEEGHSILDSLEEMDEQKVPDKWLDNRETARMIEEIVNNLPEAQRLCTFMFYYAELPVKEMAGILKVSENTVKSRLNYARKAIKEKVQSYEKQGIKLYGLSPLPFLLYFLRKCEVAAKNPEEAQIMVDKILAEEIAAAGIFAASAGTATAAGTGSVVASAGIAAIFGTAPAKVVAIFAAVCVLAGAAATAWDINSKEPGSKASPTVMSEYCEDTSDDTVTEPPKEIDEDPTAPNTDGSDSGEIDLTNHTHEYHVDYVFKACCTYEGYTSYVCSYCMDRYEDHYTGPLAHTYTKTVVPPTVFSQGYTIYECTRSCNHIHPNGSNQCRHSYISDYTDKLPADSDTSGCTHSFISKVVRDPSCRSEGIREYTCKTCGLSYTETISRYSDHDWAYSTTYPAACDAEGYDMYFCTYCGEVKHLNVKQAYGHSYTTTVVAPTETSQGYTLFSCSRCGKSFKDNYTDYSGGSVSVHTHSYTSQRYEPSCIESGNIKYTCACGHVYFDEIPSPGHNYSNSVVAPTESASGYTLHTCTVCGYSYKDSYTDLDTNADSSVPHSHSYVSSVIAPTCSTYGYTSHTCSGCGHSYTTEEISAYGHSFTTTIISPTETSRGYTVYLCTVCGLSYNGDYTDMLPSG